MELRLGDRLGFGHEWAYTARRPTRLQRDAVGEYVVPWVTGDADLIALVATENSHPVSDLVNEKRNVAAGLLLVLAAARSPEHRDAPATGSDEGLTPMRPIPRPGGIRAGVPRLPRALDWP